MFRPQRVRPENAGIFGDTSRGYPNPMVAVQRGYPTRLHGPIFTYVMPSGKYMKRPVHRAPFTGFGATPPPVLGTPCWEPSDCGGGTTCCFSPEGAGMCVDASKSAEQCIALSNWFPIACVEAGGTWSDNGCSKNTFIADPFHRQQAEDQTEPVLPPAPGPTPSGPALTEPASGSSSAPGGITIPVAAAVAAVALLLVLIVS